jgi:dihydroneopterin triphosphate diphosphatase
MARAPFQVLILPYHIDNEGTAWFAIFQRAMATGGYWQGIAGGGEDDETPLDAARREAAEEAGINTNRSFVALSAMCMLPVVNVCGFRWGTHVLVIPEYAFGVDVGDSTLRLSDEHTMHEWLKYEDARCHKSFALGQQ